VYQKYISLESIEEWVRNPSKRRSNCTIIWKELIHSFSVIGEGLAWRIGKGTKVRIKADLWPSSGINHILPDDLVQLLNENGLYYLSQISDQVRSSI
jgi:hypothetical protein